MEGKIEEERRKKKEERRKKEERKKKKNCQAHVTVLRTCSMSLGVYIRLLFVEGQSNTGHGQILLGSHMLV